MLKADLHVHTHYSNCGMHTVMEMIYHARDIGLELMAITDHGLSLGGKLCTQLFIRFENPIKEVTLLKGVECNVLENNTIDLPKNIPAKTIDVVLCGLHPKVNAPGKEPQYNTDLLIKAIKHNPCIDIITHPDHRDFPVNFEPLAETAKNHGIALELNNACTYLNKTSPEVTLDLLNVCKSTGCRIAVNSDAHTLNELGRDDAVLPYLNKIDFPEELIVNSTVAKTRDFLRERRY